MSGPRTTMLLAALAVATVGCGGDDDGDGDAAAAPTGAVAAGAGPDGAALYADNCASCHGDDLRGTAFGPSQLSNVYEPNHHPDESFRAAIRNGVVPHHWDFGAMPPIAGLDDDEITAIIAYIREVQRREGFEPYPPE